MKPHLQISNLTKRYDSNCALADVFLAVQRGACTALLGANGAGKSTLFGCILGFTRPSAGTILVNGERICDAHRARFGYTSERVALYWERSARENAVLFASLKGHPETEALAQLKRLGLEAASDEPVRNLSKGMLQRLGLAIALCGQPELLILDEPFNGLDPLLLDIFQGILSEELQRGATMLISTHTISAVEPLALHVAILSSGQLVANDSISGLRSAYPDQTSLERIYHQMLRSAELAKALAA